MTVRAVGYSRLSKEDLNKIYDDSESIKNQNNLISEYVDRQGWILQEIYSDDDFKGSDRNRPDFNRMLSDAYQNKFDVIVCKNQSRFARDIELIEKYIHGKFIEGNIRFVAIQDNIDTANMNSASKKISQLHGLTDTWYLEDLSGNISNVFDTKRKKGEYIASWALYGYLKNPENKNELIIDPVASEIVKLIFKWYIEGKGLQKIANLLNQRNIPNPLKYKKDMGMKIGAKSRITSKSYLWRGDTIGRMLENQMYMGHMVQGRLKKVSYKSKKIVCVPKDHWIIVKNTHPAIIDSETWDTVQNIRKTKVKPRRDGIVNMFNGKLRCLECSELMYAITYPKQFHGIKSKTEFNTIFRCSKKMIQSNACISTGISMNLLELHVLSELKKLSEIYFDEKFIETQLTITDSRSENLTRLQSDKERLNKQISEGNHAITTLYMDKVRGLISEKQFSQINTQILLEIKSSEEALKQVEKELGGISLNKFQKTNLSEIIERYREINKLNRNIILDLIDVIYIGRKDEKTGKRIIKILWNF